jgi:antitoxin YefM
MYSFKWRFFMQAVTYTEARASFAAMLDKVNDDHAPVLITRQSGKPAVLMSLEDFSAWEETAYLLRSPENARRLMGAVDRLNQGQGLARGVQDLVD